MDRYGRWWVLVCASTLLACEGAPRTPASEPGNRPEAGPPAECEPLWAREPSREFVEMLVEATRAPVPVWNGYGLADGAYVLHAGSSESGEACLGVWRGGRALAFAALAEEPTLNTPLYGYHLPAEGGEGDQAQPPSIRAWLEEVGVDRATLMPTEVEDFPIPLSPLVKVQLALHEGFHVEVQAPGWRDDTAPAPVWDQQPDRQALQGCYAGGPAVEEALGAERAALVSHVEALLDGDSARACGAGAEFLSRRASRRASLEGVDVPRHDGSPGTCREAEAIMELEEGTADYASWTLLHDLGLATRDQLLGRYRAQQDELFYLTGAMQLHAASLLHPGGMARISRDVVESTTPDEGSIEVVFTRALESYCGRTDEGRGVSGS